MTKHKLSSESVIASLRLHFAQPRWAFLEQVGNATGYSTRSWIDAMAFSLWPSQGLSAEGIEVKVSRGDWRRELKDPAKADEVGKNCHRFWVAAPVGIVPIEEVPGAWGLLEVEDRTKPPKVVKKADLLTPPAPTWGFVCAILRRAGEYQDRLQAHGVPAEELEVRVKAAVDRELPAAVERKTRLEKDRANMAELNLQRLRQSVTAFEENSGIKVSDYSHRRIGHIVAALLKAEPKNLEHHVAQARNHAFQMRQLADGIDEALKSEAPT